jgi:hypothetical protein
MRRVVALYPALCFCLRVVLRNYLSLKLDDPFLKRRAPLDIQLRIRHGENYIPVGEGAAFIWISSTTVTWLFSAALIIVKAEGNTMANDQMRLWATTINEGQLDVWRKEGRTCIFMVAAPDGHCLISAFETEAEALAEKEKADKMLGKGHSIIRPIAKSAAAGVK